MTTRFISALLTLLFSFSSTQAGEPVKHVNAKEAAEIVQKGGVTVVDVRTPDEYSEGHIKGSVNVDFRDKGFEAAASKLDKQQPILVHCQAGGRSSESLATFQKLGFEKIIHLDGGMNDWLDAGQPVEKKK